MRDTLSLDGLWKYLIDPSGRGDGWLEYHRRRSSDPDLDWMRGYERLAWREMRIPGSWNLVDPALQWYEGIVWFAREFDLPKEWAGKHVCLRFGAVNYHAKVWLNEEPVGEHEGGYTPFEIMVTGSLKPTGNLLVVKVHNRQLPDSTCPILPMMNYGGIYRSVSLVATGPARIRWLAVLPELDERLERAVLTIRFEVQNTSDRDLHLELVLRIIDPDGRLVASPRGIVEAKAAGIAEGALTVAVERPDLWDVASPRLYRAEASLEGPEGALDAVRPTFGIRRVDVRDGRIHLNGRPVFLRGICKHDEYPGLGRTIPDEIYRSDFRIIRELGANAVRLAHYPHDERETQLADELGLLLWEETLMVWNVDFSNPAVHRKVCQQLEELVRRDINHPSVILWSLGNEIPTTTPEAEQCLRSEIEVVRRLDPTRLMTFATWPLDVAANKPLGLVDVISFNKYRGWYYPNVAGIVDDIQEYHDAHPAKPIIVSEFGAGSVRGFHSESRDRWSEEYQEWVLDQNLQAMRSSSWLCGCFVWNLVDFADPTRPYTVFEPFLNNKGLLDEYRREKKAYGTVRRHYTELGERPT